MEEHWDRYIIQFRSYLTFCLKIQADAELLVTPGLCDRLYIVSAQEINHLYEYLLKKRKLKL